MQGPLQTLQHALFGYSLTNTAFFVQALTHSSFRNEFGRAEPNNERLEFLGDSVLDLILSQRLMKVFPKASEGILSKQRASLVNELALSEVAIELGLPDIVRLGRGERAAGIENRPRLLASALEAIIGALFLDAGFKTTEEVLLKLFGARIEKLKSVADSEILDADYKSRFQERVQEKFKTTPVYELIGESGPSHGKVFLVQLLVNGKIEASGMGKSKKAAEQAAAREALTKKETQ